MQTIVDLPEPQLEALNALAKARNQTPSEFIAEVLAGVLHAENSNPEEPKPLIDGFHLWGEHVTDGLEYERRIRAEWDDR